MDSLVAKSIVATRPVGAMMRYRLLDTTRAYVLEIRIDDAEAADLAVRHAAYYRRWLEQTGIEWPNLATGEERAPHFAAINNARAALEWSFGSDGGSCESVSGSPRRPCRSSWRCPCCPNAIAGRSTRDSHPR